MFRGEKAEKAKKVCFWGAAGLLVVAIVAVIAGGGRGKTPESTEAVRSTAEPIVRYVTQTETVYVDKIVPVEVEKEITTEILEEGLQEMGFLITEKYLFTEVTTFESTRSYAWIIKANSKLVMGYDGCLSAGIDFGAVKLRKDDVNHRITVKLPKAEIYGCELDLESFEVYQEDVSKWNPISAEDYNGSLIELENRARERALERGILDMAASNAQTLIRGFIGGLVDLDQYRIDFEG